MTTLLIPLDRSAASQAALPVAEWLARLLHADVVLLSIGELAETSTQAAEGDAEKARVFESAMPHFKGLTVRCRSETAEGPAAAILRTVDEEHIDLVVMSTHGKAGTTQVAREEIADEVIDAGVVPVTVVRYQNEA